MKKKILKKISLIKSSEVISPKEMEMILAGSGASCVTSCYSGGCKVLVCERLNGAGDCGCR